VEVEMSSILLAIAWAGAGSGTLTPSGALADLVIALGLTGAVAWLARESQRQRARCREEALAMAVPAAGVH
jgi:hypothetical protein